MAKKKKEAVVETASIELNKEFESGFKIKYVVEGSCSYMKDGEVYMIISMKIYLFVLLQTIAWIMVYGFINKLLLVLSAL